MLGSPLRVVSVVQGYRWIASLNPTSSPRSPDPFFFGPGDTFSRAALIDPPSDKNSLLATGSFNTRRRFLISFELVISLLLIRRMIALRTSGVRSLRFRFLISRAQVIDAPGSGREVILSDN